MNTEPTLTSNPTVATIERLAAYTPNDDNENAGMSGNASTSSVFELGSFMGMKLVYWGLLTFAICILLCVMVVSIMYCIRRRKINKALDTITLTAFTSQQSVATLSPPSETPTRYPSYAITM